MKTLDALLQEGVAGRRVLLRADLNVPLDDDARITDDGRIRAVIPTIEALRDNGARVVLCAHLGRPKGERNPSMSLAPVSVRLAEILGAPVLFASDTVGAEAKKVVDALTDGGVALLENLRFSPYETSKNDDERLQFAHQLAALADVYVDDAFGAVHRKHASVFDVATLLPSYAGHLVSKEVSVLSGLTHEPRRPYTVVLGGAKVSDKLAVIDNLLDKVDQLLVGGGMMFTFLAAQGHSTGDSLLEESQIARCKQFVDRAKQLGVELVLPVDTVTGETFSADTQPQVCGISTIPKGQMGLDIGPETARMFAAKLHDSATVFWNGPMGVFEFDAFAAGTRTVAEAIAESGAFSVVGGGDSAAAIRAMELDESAFDHISTGGGASLEYLEGKQLPGLAILEP